MMVPSTAGRDCLEFNGFTERGESEWWRGERTGWKLLCLLIRLAGGSFVIVEMNLSLNLL